MPKRPHTELRYSPDGPWITMHGDTGSVTINLREVMRGELFAANRDWRRIISEWIKGPRRRGRGFEYRCAGCPCRHVPETEDEGEAVDRYHPAMSYNPEQLGAFEWRMVRLYCPDCHRLAQYCKTTLMDRFGGDSCHL